MKPGLRKKLERVRLFLCDVDGVLTDGAVWMGAGVEMKRWDIRDGLGMRFLQRFGIRVGWVSRRRSRATTARARDLQVDHVLQIEGSKVVAVEALLGQLGVGWDAVCYVGDDVVDLGVLRLAGVSVVVADGIAEAKAMADYVTVAHGGRGAIREIVDLILKAQNRWEILLEEYSR